MMRQLSRFINNPNNLNFLLFQRLRFVSPSSTLISTLNFSSSSTSTSTSTSTSINPNINNAGLYAKMLADLLGFSKQQSLAISAYLVKWRHKDNGSHVVVLFDPKFVDNAHCLIHYFNQLGFLNSDIRKLVSAYPRFMCIRVDDILKSKINVLIEAGISGADLVHVISRNPSMLGYQCLGSVIHALRTVLGTHENVVSFLKRSRSINFKAVADNLIPNVELLRTCYGIPIEGIHRFLMRHPILFIARSDLFRDIVAKVEDKLGIPRDSAMFMYGIHLLTFCDNSKFEDKCAVFKSFGWDQSVVMTFIRQNPMCFLLSEGRVKERLSFLMNQLGYEPRYLVSRTALISCSFEKRLLPRHRVLQVLNEKGLVKRNYSLYTLVRFPESKFVERFVLPFEEAQQVYEQLTGCKIGSHTAGIAKAQLEK